VAEASETTVVVTDEATEAFRTAFLATVDPDECKPRFSAIVAGLAAAAPPIAAQALRETAEDVRGRIQGRNGSLVADMALSTVARTLDERADELERGTDQ
jgi:hypothetical protein